MKKVLPIGEDSFREIRKEKSFYYVDKSLIIKDFIEFKNRVALITRPRRFGKTLNMSMIGEFFDITKDNKDLFEGLAIMDTEYVEYLNSRPVVYFSFKNCSANDAESLKMKLIQAISTEYIRYYNIFTDEINQEDYHYSRYFHTLDAINKRDVEWYELEESIYYLMVAVTKYYNATPILLIDEYDQPILSSYEYGYRDEMGGFFENFFGLILKGNDYLFQAMLTGIQRVAKESIFSKLNNIVVYTVLDEFYSPYFGLDSNETEALLNYYGLELNDEVRSQYDGYVFGGIHMYNPWSVINYAHKKILTPYWINTSTNSLIRNAIASSGDLFKREFDQLLSRHQATVGIELETSFIELENSETLWGLLVNAGYLTVLKRVNMFNMIVAIPNDEVRYEFQKIIAEQANISGGELNRMFQALLRQDMDEFVEVYSRIVLSCTSYHDARENAYHMLFLGMCISLKNLYRITGNIESGHGRSDITLESLTKDRFHIIIEFKQGKDIESLKKEGLNQILENKYYAGLKGKVLCVGLTHDIKHCEMEYKLIQTPLN